MTTKELFTEIAKDESVIKEISSIRDPQKVYELLKGKGLTDSFEDFKKTATELSEEAVKLSESDIDAIVGGNAADVTYYATLTAIGTFTVASASAIV